MGEFWARSYSTRKKKKRGIPGEGRSTPLLLKGKLKKGSNVITRGNLKGGNRWGEKRKEGNTFLSPKNRNRVGGERENTFPLKLMQGSSGESVRRCSDKPKAQCKGRQNGERSTSPAGVSTGGEETLSRRNRISEGQMEKKGMKSLVPKRGKVHGGDHQKNRDLHVFEEPKIVSGKKRELTGKKTSGGKIAKKPTRKRIDSIENRTNSVDGGKKLILKFLKNGQKEKGSILKQH